MEDRDLEELRHHLRNAGQNIMELLRLIEKELVRMKKAIEDHNKRMEEHHAAKNGSIGKMPKEGD